MPRGVLTAEQRENHSAAMRSPVTRQRLSTAQRQSVPVRNRGAHARIDYDRGRASTHVCVDCGGPAQDWSFKHETPESRTLRDASGQRAGMPYSLDPSDYDPRCRPCHLRYDRKENR